MDKLLEAARRGNVEELHLLLRENPHVLHYVALESVELNPLHLACLYGHLDFAREMLILKPEFAKKLNPRGHSPVHMAAAHGHVEIVKELIRFDLNLCRLKGRDMRTPLHYAALEGETGVITEILSVCPESTEDVTIQGETALHLAVKRCQFESLQVMVDWVRKMGKEEILDVNDEQYNTTLSLAMQMEEQQVLQLLSSNRNGSGTSSQLVFPINVETQDRLHSHERIVSSSSAHQHSTCRNTTECFRFREGRDSPSDVNNMLLVVAVLVATATYQVGITPPGGTWQDNSTATGGNNSSGSDPWPIAGRSILATYDYVGYIIILVFNSIGLSVSLSMIAMLTRRFPLRVEIYVCMLSLYATYYTALQYITPVKGSVIVVVFNVVLPTLVPLILCFSRKYLVPKMAAIGSSLIKYKVVRFLADHYGCRR